jgi:hypothetical protein
MSDKNKQKLTLDRPAKYQIQVPGELDLDWFDGANDVTISISLNEAGLPVSTMIGVFDQAALQGFLRRLYARGISLISVMCLDLA